MKTEILDTILSKEELMDLSEEGIIDYLNNLNSTLYLTGWYNLGNHLEEISDVLKQTFDDEEYLIYIKYILERNDVFILDEYSLDKYEYPKAYLLSEYCVEYKDIYNRIIYYEQWDNIYYYDYDGIINMYINEIMEIPQHLEDYIDYDSIIRGYKIDDHLHIVGRDGDYEMLDITELK